MKCPDCMGKVVFGKHGVSCASCGWQPSDLVQRQYGLAPWSNRRIAFSALSLTASIIIFGLLTGNDFFMLVGIALGVSVAAVSIVARDAVMRWMIKQAENVE